MEVCNESKLFFLEGIVGRVKDCKCELDKCKDIKKMAISTRKSFEKDIENAKTIFFNEARQEILYTPEDEPDLSEKWSIIEKIIRDEFEEQMVYIERSVAKKKAFIYIVIILTIAGGIALLYFYDAVKHGRL